MQTNDLPLVSVVIPTYRRTVEYLSRAVDSVLSQTYPNVEIIVIDDSTSAYDKQHETKAYFDSLGRDNVIYLQNEKNLNGALTRNRGIDIASGEYITFLDDDDEYLPEKIERQLAFMLKNGCDASFTDLALYSAEGTMVDYREYSAIESFDNEYLLRYHLTRHLTGTPTFMFKADKLREIGGFNSVKVGQEFHLMLKAILAGLKIRYMPECHVKAYRHPDGGISGGENKIAGEKELFAFKQQFFPKLSKAEQRFVRFRYHAVLAAGYKRTGKYGNMLAEAIKTVLTSPVDFVKEALKIFKKLKAHKNDSSV